VLDGSRNSPLLSGECGTGEPDYLDESGSQHRNAPRRSFEDPLPRARLRLGPDQTIAFGSDDLVSDGNFVREEVDMYASTDGDLWIATYPLCVELAVADASSGPVRSLKLALRNSAWPGCRLGYSHWSGPNRVSWSYAR
jgi:hypothetical protein